MATYIKDLKEDNGDIVYPHTNTDAVYTSGGETLETRISKYVTAEDIASSVQSFGTVTSGMIDDDAITTAKLDDGAVTTAKIDDDAVTNAKIADGAVESQNIDWSTLDGSEIGWKYLGETKLNSASDTVEFTLPEQYSCYKIIFGGQMTSGTSSNTWLDLNFMNGTSSIANTHQTQEVAGTTSTNSIATNVSYLVNAGSSGVSAYDGVNIDMYSVKTDSTQWRKFQCNYYRAGGSITTVVSNGRMTSATEPTSIRIKSGGQFNAGAMMKVWGCNV